VGPDWEERAHAIAERACPPEVREAIEAAAKNFGRGMSGSQFGTGYRFKTYREPTPDIVVNIKVVSADATDSAATRPKAKPN
jgi:hypothetical protein